MSNEVTVNMPTRLTKDMMDAVKDHPFTSFDDKAKWHEHLGWLICAYEIIIEQRINQQP